MVRVGVKGWSLQFGFRVRVRVGFRVGVMGWGLGWG